MTDDRKLLAIVCAGVVLRVIVAVASEPWTDELFFVVTARGVPAELATYLAAAPGVITSGFDAREILATTPRLAKEAHPPLLLLASALIPHDAPAWLLRLPALALGVATLLLAVWWARRRMSAPGAFAVAVLFATAFPLVYHGAEARPYAGAIAFGLASTLLAIGPAPGARWGAWLYVLYGLVCALGLYSHYYVGGLYPAQLAAALLACRGDRARRRHVVGLLLGLFLAALLFLPWAPVPWTKAQMFSAAEDAAAPTVAGLLFGGAAMVGGVAIEWPTRVGWVAALTSLAVLVAGLWRWSRVQPAAAWQLALAPLGLAVLVVAAPHVHAFQPKHLAPAAGPLLLALAGVWARPETSRRLATLLIAILVLQAGVLVTGLSRPREPWRLAWHVAASQLRPGDVVVFHPAHAKLAFHRQLAQAGRRLYPADDRLRSRPDWGLPLLGVPNFRDSPEAAFWLHDSSTLAPGPQALHVWLFGLHAVPVPDELPPETLRGKEGHVYMEIGPVHGR